MWSSEECRLWAEFWTEEGAAFFHYNSTTEECRLYQTLHAECQAVGGPNEAPPFDQCEATPTTTGSTAPTTHTQLSTTTTKKTTAATVPTTATITVTKTTTIAITTAATTSATSATKGRTYDKKEGR